MASGLGALLNIGNGALFGSQAALQTTGNNIANVNTAGYSRQEVRFESWPSLDYFPGQMGQGVKAAEVMRHFDKFVERSFLTQYTQQVRWETQFNNMRSLENIFNESSGLGLNTHMSSFFNGWEKVSQFPNDIASREALLGQAQTMVDSIRSAENSLTQLEQSVNDAVAMDVAQANELIKQIAALNKQINIHSVPGQNNPNEMLDKRDLLVRQLATLIDVDVIDKGAGNYIVNTKGGQTLVDGGNTFALDFKDSFAYQNKIQGTTFDGSIGFSGSDGYEYTIEFTQGGTLGSTPPPLFKVSLDGGRTWVRDEDGNVMEFEAHEEDKAVKVKDLEIYFNKGTNDNLIVGDGFTIVPKSSLYYIEPTIGPINITPRQFGDGVDDTQRASGGTISGNLLFRDYQAGKIRDQLNELSKNLIWETNRIHSQGAGVDKLTSSLGTYSVNDPSYPLGSQYSGLTWSDRLQSGNFSIALYDPASGNPILFEPGLSPSLSINFDPETDSLNDVITRMQSTTVNWTDAAGVAHTDPLSNFLNIGVSVNNTLEISSKNGHKFGFTDDSTGLLAGLGINTFFKGDNAGNISIRDELVQNPNLINAGRINGGAEINDGDSIVARDIARLIEQTVGFKDWTGRVNNQTLGNFYGGLVSSVGSMTNQSAFNATTIGTVAAELDDRQSELAGVNLDEEMSNLIKFQSSYKAAAKLITTADQMFQTLLAIKQ